MTDVTVERIPNIPQRPQMRRVPMTIVRQGVSMGMALAMICSWHEHRSIFWAIIHGVFSWLYVLYYAVVY
jgi:hypothetical protein